jgi:tRNA threonylcarbamoyladenosine biosynthesis protein TsaB
MKLWSLQRLSLKSWRKRMHDAIVIALSSPVLVGIYKDGYLVEEIRSEGMSSDVLAEIFDALFKKYHFSHLIYAKGPGSFMGIKVTYLFLKTLSITKKIPLLATDAFFFNQNSPIKAVGKLYFVKNRTTIELEPLVSPEIIAFELPKNIDIEKFDSDNLPYYGIDAVG